MLKNKRLIVLTVVLSMLVAMFVVVTPVNAGIASTSTSSEPVYVELNEAPYFFANGTAITIEDTQEAGYGALITWNGGEKLVPANTQVFGGMHNNDTEVNSSITMNGGQVAYIIAGGLHKSNTKTSTLTINGGTVRQVNGGGALGWNIECVGVEGGCTSADANGTKGDNENSVCYTGKATINVNAGNILSVYGGGCQWAHTEEVVINIKGGTVAPDSNGKGGIILATGSSGSVGTANVNITGGELSDASLRTAGNEGSVEDVTVNIENVELAEVVVGSKDAKAFETTGKVTVTVEDDATVEKLELGYNNNNVIDNETNPVELDVTYAKGAVENSTIPEDENAKEIIKVTVNGTEHELEIGKTLADVEGIEDEKVKEGHTFKGFVKTGTTEFIAETTALADHISVDSLFEVNNYKVTINGKEYTVAHGTALGDIEGLIDDIQRDGFVVVTVKDATGKEYMPEDVVTGDMNLVVVYEPEGLGDDTTAGDIEENAKDDAGEENVDTADNIVSYVTIFTLAVVGFAVMFTVVRKNKVSKK